MKIAPIYRNFPQNKAIRSLVAIIVAKKPKLQIDILKHIKKKILLIVALLFLKSTNTPNNKLERNVIIKGNVKLLTMFIRQISLEAKIQVFLFCILNIHH